MGARVRLREATRADTRLLELWQGDEYRGEFNDFGLPSRPIGPTLRDHGLIGDDYGALIVEVAAGGKPIGTVSWHAVNYGPNPEAPVWNIGINLVPEARYLGYGGEAQHLLALRLFATTTVNRVEAMTDVENVAEQRALEKGGFVREGVLRGAQYRAGRWHDLVVYSMLRPDGAPAKAAPPTI